MKKEINEEEEGEDNEDNELSIDIKYNISTMLQNRE